MPSLSVAEHSEPSQRTEHRKVETKNNFMREMTGPDSSAVIKITSLLEGYTLEETTIQKDTWTSEFITTLFKNSQDMGMKPDVHQQMNG